MRAFRFLFIVGFLVTSASAFGLVAPWYQYWHQVRATIGADRCVVIPELISATGGSKSVYQLRMAVCDGKKAEALNRLVKRKMSWGGVELEAFVELPSGATLPKPTAITLTPAQAAEVVKDALGDNPYFSEVAVEQGPFSIVVWLELKKSVVQFFTDDLGDRYGNANLVAARAFSDVVDLDSLGVNLRATTAR